MELFNRLLVTLLACCTAAGGAFVLAVAGGMVGPDALEQAPALQSAVAGLQGLSGWSAAVGSGAGAAAIGLGLLLLVLELRPSKQGGQVTIREDRLGSVTVSLQGLRRLADHVVRELPGVEGVLSDARNTGKGVRFACRVVVAPEVSTPDLSEQIRERLGEAVRNHIGQPASLTRIDVQAQVGSLQQDRKRVH